MISATQARSTSPWSGPAKCGSGGGGGEMAMFMLKKIDTSETTDSVNEFLTFLYTFLRLGAQ